jgi:hypothetical protein
MFISDWATARIVPQIEYTFNSKCPGTLQIAGTAQIFVESFLARKIAVDPGEENSVDAKRLCPSCQSPRVYRSHREGLLDRLHSWLGRYPHRCHACNHRFRLKYSGSDPHHGEKDPRPDLRKRKMRRLLRDLVIGASCVLLFLIFLYYLIQPRSE